MNEDAARTAITVLSRALNQDLVVTVGDRWNEDLEALKILLSDGLAELTVLPARGLTACPTAAGIGLLEVAGRIQREETAEARIRTDSRIASAYAEAASALLARTPVTRHSAVDAEELASPPGFKEQGGPPDRRHGPPPDRGVLRGVVMWAVAGPEGEAIAQAASQLPETDTCD